jgi:hypothetical protein
MNRKHQIDCLEKHLLLTERSMLIMFHAEKVTLHVTDSFGRVISDRLNTNIRYFVQLKMKEEQDYEKTIDEHPAHPLYGTVIGGRPFVC